ncbi:hypothetical protein F53441_4221 [Fusarium austroafricanum]|uniref:Uncharacterized protein n=1 Tax=Fusarium austroafricanum TaxID=2364996 RepID=A0A8H4KMR8_9HYPO|nr:hypothetical protein F53441_4221 [Fusarium austroafricanum]
MTELSDWPPPFATLLGLLEERTSMYYFMSDMLDRLVQQELFDYTDSNSPSILSLKIQNKETFYSILDCADYDHRIAYFLSLPTSDHSLAIDNWLEAQKAVGAAGVLIRSGTIWATLGISNALWESDQKAPDLPSHYFAGDRILVEKRNDDDSDEGIPKKMTRAEYREISEHLLLAYAHQVAVLVQSEGENLIFSDILSGQTLILPFGTWLVVDFELLKRWANGKQLVGVYTKLERNEQGKTFMHNWTYIPSDIWEKWKPKLTLYRGLHNPDAQFLLHRLEANEDEILGADLELPGLQRIEPDN